MTKFIPKIYFQRGFGNAFLEFADQITCLKKVKKKKEEKVAYLDGAVGDNT